MALKTSLPTEVSIEHSKAVLIDMQTLRHDLGAWVQYTFPWGVSGPLERFEGPRQWQKDELNRVSEHLHRNLEMMRKGDLPKVYKSCITSGRGIGKTAMIAWLSLWQMSCQLGSSTVIAANNELQLAKYTFAELHNWLGMAINSYWWEPIQTLVRPAEMLTKGMKGKFLAEKYYILGRLWAEENADAFAGLHNPDGFLLVFDEATGIPKPIWNVSDGFFSDVSAYRLWFAFSNPRSNTGEVYECFHNEKKKEYWYTRQIDARTVEGLDHDHFAAIIEENGIDSDKARIEVLGQFPMQGDFQFISRGLVNDALQRQFDQADDHSALVLGIDPARHGPDSTVMRFRKGRDAKSFPATEVNGRDTVEVTNIAVDLILRFKPEAVFIDMGGVGAGVYDLLRRQKFNIFGVDFGWKAQDKDRYYNTRTELWSKMEEWLKFAQLPNHIKLVEDLVTPFREYMPNGKVNLEAKDKMRRRGVKSPDHGDALALTFFKDIAPTNNPLSRNRYPRKAARIASGVGCDIPGFD